MLARASSPAIANGSTHLAHLGAAEPLDHAGVEQKPQRHASARSSRQASDEIAKAAATRRPRRDVARRSASFTVSLIVVVPSSREPRRACSHRDRPNVSPQDPVYTEGRRVYPNDPPLTDPSTVTGGRLR